MVISSWAFCTPSSPSKISATSAWNTSEAWWTPKGSLLNLYLPNGELKVSSFELSLSTQICRLTGNHGNLESTEKMTLVSFHKSSSSETNFLTLIDLL